MVKESKYKFLEHKADAKFKAFGKTLNQQFQNAALALTKVITDDKIKPKITKKIKVKGIDKQNLLLNFLEELLFLIDTKNFLVSKTKVKIKTNESKIRGTENAKHVSEELNLQAELKGDNLKHYETKTHIKAVTYNKMKICKDYVQVIIDI